MNRTKRKLLSGVLAVALLLQTAMPSGVFAAEPAAKTIVGFSALAQTEYTLPIGADETKVGELLATFPETITAKAEYIVTEEVTQPPAPPDADSGKPETLPAEGTGEEGAVEDPPIDDASSESDTQGPATVLDSGESGNSTEQPKTAADSDADEQEPSDKEESLPDTSLPDTSLVEKVVSEQVELAVTWESDKPLTTEKAGAFTYTAVLSDTDKGRYDLAADVRPPELTVTVEEPLAMMTATPQEQFNLATGETYYFDLSSVKGDISSIGVIIDGDVATSIDYPGIPDPSLHFVPFTYVGTVSGYSRPSADEIVEIQPWPRSLFVADYNVAHRIFWEEMNNKNFIYGRSFGGHYVLRTLSVGNASNNGVITPPTQRVGPDFGKKQRLHQKLEEPGVMGTRLPPVL